MRSLALALLVLLASAAPAAAGGTLLPDDESQVRWGPLFAGERLTWATFDAQPDGVRIHTANVDGSGRSTRTIEAPVRRAGTRPWFAMGASEKRIAASLHLTFCAGSCKYMNYEFPYSRVVSAAGDGAFEPFSSPCISPYTARASVAVDGDVVAHLTCTEVVVYDHAAPAGEERVFRYPESTQVRLAGPLLGSLETGSNGALVVREWRTGAERLRIPGSVGLHDLRPDGTVVYVRDGRVWTASPAAPEPRAVAEDALGGVELAGDRVAYTRQGGGVGVRRLDGSLVAESPVARLADFDGERVAWVDETCARTAIATWDLQGDAPALPRANPCPIATLRSPILRAQGEQSVKVKLGCAPEPAVGCAGQVTLFAKDSRRKYPDRTVDLATGVYRLAPGATTTLELGYGKRRVCIAGRNGLRPIVEITGAGRRKSRRARVAGLDEALAACSSRAP